MMKNAALAFLLGSFNTENSIGDIVAYFHGQYKVVPCGYDWQNTAFKEPRPIYSDKIGLSSYIECSRKKIKEIKEKYDNVILAGHSVGGTIAQVLAAEEDVAAAIFIAPSAPAGIKNLSWPVIKTFLSSFLPDPWNLDKAVKRSLAGTKYGVLEDDLDDEEVQIIYDRLAWMPRRVLWDLAFSKPRVNEKKVMCPTLVIGFSSDRLIGPKVAKKIATKYGSDYIEINGPHYPDWFTVATEVDKWLNLKKLI